MEDLYLSKLDLDETNASKIVEFVKAYEREQGLNDDEIAIKYTQAYCSTLADAIRMVFGAYLDKVIDTKTFFAKEEQEGRVLSHTYAEIGEDKFVDIFGVHNKQEVEDFLDSGFLSAPEAVKNFEKNRERYSATGNIMYECLGRIHPQAESLAEDSSKQSLGNFRSL